MRLEKLLVKNFRGYKDETILDIANLTALIGKNDAGKSTLLEALEIFFNNKLIVCEREDLSVSCTSSERNIEISCIFSGFPPVLTIDSASETALDSEYLLNNEGFLQIKKTFSCTAAKPKAVTSIVCEHPTTNYYDDLLQLKQTDLKARLDLLNIEKNGIDLRNNALIRGAIWNHCDELNLQEREINVNDAESKKIFGVLETYLPSFALFQSDRSSNDSDKEITDPMSVAVSQALLGLESEMNKIKEEVRRKTMESATRTLEKLKEMNQDLADSLLPEFKTEPKFDSLFKLSIKSDDGISINKRGSGVRRLILLNFFRAEAERKLSENEKQSNIIYAFEEPETSQHPSHQRMLVESFLKLSEKENCQVLLTTHTPALGELLPLDSLRLVTKDNNKKNIIKQGLDEIYHEIAETLGVLSATIPNSAGGIILVEGKSDFIFLNHLCELLKEGGKIVSTLNEKNIALVPVGGCDNLKLWVTLQVIDQFKLPWAVFMDSDRMNISHITKNIEMINNLKEEGVSAHVTKKREIENYLHPDLFNGKVEITNFNDVKKEINIYDDTIGRGKIIDKFWPLMTYDKLKETEEYVDEKGNTRFELTEIVNELLLITG